MKGRQTLCRHSLWLFRTQSICSQFPLGWFVPNEIFSWVVLRQLRKHKHSIAYFHCIYHSTNFAIAGLYCGFYGDCNMDNFWQCVYFFVLFHISLRDWIVFKRTKLCCLCLFPLQSAFWIQTRVMHGLDFGKIRFGEQRHFIHSGNVFFVCVERGRYVCIWEDFSFMLYGVPVRELIPTLVHNQKDYLSNGCV